MTISYAYLTWNFICILEISNYSQIIRAIAISCNQQIIQKSAGTSVFDLLELSTILSSLKVLIQPKYMEIIFSIFFVRFS